MNAASIVDQRSRLDRAEAGTAPSATTDWPGRWLGGAIGAAVSLGAAVLLFAVQDRSSGQSDLLIPSSPWIAHLGIPIAFALGRGAFPSIRGGTWGWALAAGVLIGLAAPPLGAFEIVFGPFLLPLDPGNTDQIGLVAVLPIALVFSFVAILITVPVGLVTAIAIRALPRELPSRLRAPEWLARVGLSHAIGFLVVWGIAAQVVTAIARG
jgi:hypothetical protein